MPWSTLLKRAFLGSWHGIWYSQFLSEYFHIWTYCLFSFCMHLIVESHKRCGMNGDNKWPCLFGIKFCTWAGFIMFIGWYSPSEAKFRWKNVQTFLKYFKPKLKIGKKKKNYDNMDLEFFCSVFVVIDHFLSKNSPAVYWNCREFFYSKFMIDGDMKFPFKIWNSTILPCKQPSMM